MERRWTFHRPDPARSRALAERLAVSEIAAQVLLNRGIDDDGAAKRFLAPELRHLHEPSCFREIGRAAERILAAAAAGEPIVLYGDYDVDGATGTAILQRFLRMVGARVSVFIPDRIRDGYGMRAARIAEAAASGARVVVSIDNGTTAFAAAEEARRLGIDLIVTDHHEPSVSPEGAALLPPVHSLVNPKVPGETYPFAGICGCGVAFKLAWAMAQRRSPGSRVTPDMRAFLVDALSLVAIGTIADMVPLVDENRVLAAFGLRSLAGTRNLGLRALMRVARIDGHPTADDVAYRLAPRLNAAGRLGDARLVLDLLAAESGDQATALALRLEDENRRRRGIEKQIFEEALPRAERALAETGGRAVVLADDRWHLGVLGIVASRLVAHFGRPTVLIALQGDRGRGSARSVPGVPLPAAFARCREDLLGFGGHDAAAGLEIRADRVDRFRARLAEALAAAGVEDAAAGGAAAAGEPLAIDLEVPLGACSKALVDELERLGPHGRGNEPPVFAADGVELATPPRIVGQDGGHLSLHVRQGGAVVRAIGYGLGARAAKLASGGPGRLSIAFRPFVSRWGGQAAVELEMLDFRASPAPAGGAAARRSADHGEPRPRAAG